MVYDVTNARRIKGILNALRDIGMLVSVSILFFSTVDRRFLLVLIAYLVANAYLAKCSRLAPIVLAAIALGLAAFLEHGHQIALASLEERISAGELDKITASSTRRMIELNRTLALGYLMLGVIYAAALVLPFAFSHLLPKPAPELAFRQRITLQLKRIRAGLTSRAILYYALSTICALVVLAPAIVHIVALVLHVKWSDLPSAIRNPGMDGGWLYLVITIIGGVGCLVLFVKGKRAASISLATACSIDPRTPILLLRSFQDDTTALARTTDPRAWMRSLFVPGVWTLEETVERVLATHGPLVAIGRPGESVPPAGAAREYVSNDRWRARVKEHIDEARLVVVIVGKSEGLEFEYRALMERGALGKLVLVLPPVGPGETEERWATFCRLTGRRTDPNGNSNLLNALAGFFVQGNSAGFVTCRGSRDEDSYELSLERALFEVL